MSRRVIVRPEGDLFVVVILDSHGREERIDCYCSTREWAETEARQIRAALRKAFQ